MRSSILRFVAATMAAFLSCFILMAVIFHRPSPELIRTVHYERCDNCKIETKEEKAFVDTLLSDPTAVFTALLFFATVVLAVVTIGLYLEARNTGKEQVAAAKDSAMQAARSAKAAEGAIAASNLSYERQLRAYMSVLNVSIFPINAGNLSRVSIQTKNFGQTPAKNVIIDHYSECVVMPNRDRVPDFTVAAAYKASTAFVCSPTMANETSSVFAPITAFSTNLSTGVMHRMFIKGQINYTDVFNQRRCTDFCFHYVDDNINSPRFVPWSVGNDIT